MSCKKVDGVRIIDRIAMLIYNSVYEWILQLIKYNLYDCSPKCGHKFQSQADKGPSVRATMAATTSTSTTATATATTSTTATEEPTTATVIPTTIQILRHQRERNTTRKVSVMSFCFLVLAVPLLLHHQYVVNVDFQYDLHMTAALFLSYHICQKLW